VVGSLVHCVLEDLVVWAMYSGLAILMGIVSQVGAALTLGYGL